MDTIHGRILPDGTLKLQTDDAISTPNHMSADKLIKAIELECGGQTEVKKNPKAVHHQHVHEHAKESH